MRFLAAEAREHFEAVVRRIAGKRLDPREIAFILNAADRYHQTGRYKDDVAPCGTPAAYKRHTRRREPIDQMCQVVVSGQPVGEGEPAPAVVRFTAALIFKAAREGDRREAARLVSALPHGSDVTELVMLLARCADWTRLNTATGYVAGATPTELHAAFVRLRNRGVPKRDIAAYIVAGEQEYQRTIKAAKRAVVRRAA